MSRYTIITNGDKYKNATLKALGYRVAAFPKSTEEKMRVPLVMKGKLETEQKDEDDVKRYVPNNAPLISEEHRGNPLVSAANIVLGKDTTQKVSSQLDPMVGDDNEVKIYTPKSGEKISVESAVDEVVNAIPEEVKKVAVEEQQILSNPNDFENFKKPEKTPFSGIKEKIKTLCDLMIERHKIDAQIEEIVENLPNEAEKLEKAVAVVFQKQNQNKAAEGAAIDEALNNAPVDETVNSINIPGRM